MSQYLLLLHGSNGTSTDMSPEQLQHMLQRYAAWAGALHQQGRLRGGEKLRDDGGRGLRAERGEIVVDGPFVETKETIGGYFVVEAADYAEAIEIARGCPALRDGGSVELREIEPM